MDESVKILIISSSVTGFFTIVTFFITKWIEARQKRAGQKDETSGQIALRRFDQEESIRKEMQIKMDRMETVINRHERAFGQLRNTIGDLIRETLMTMQLAMHDIRSNNSEGALKRLEDGVKRLAETKLPDLPSVDDEYRNKKE